MTLLTTSNGPKSGVRNAIKALADEASGQIADARHFAQRVRTANIPDGDPFPNTPSGGLVLKALATSATLAALTQRSAILSQEILLLFYLQQRLLPMQP